MSMAFLKCINGEVERSKEHVFRLILRFSFNINLSPLEIFAFYDSILFEGSRFKEVYFREIIHRKPAG